LIKKFRDDLQNPPKGSSLPRGFSQANHLVPKHSLQTWLVSRIHPCELPKLHGHKFVSHPKVRNMLKSASTALDDPASFVGSAPLNNRICPLAKIH